MNYGSLDQLALSLKEVYICVHIYVSDLGEHSDVLKPEIPYTM